MANDSADTSKDSHFSARLDAAFALWDARVCAQLRAALKPRRWRRPKDKREVLDALARQLADTEQELATTREELARTRRAAADWENKAMLSLREEREDLASSAIRKIQELNQIAIQLEGDQDLLELTASALRGTIANLETME